MFWEQGLLGMGVRSWPAAALLAGILALLASATGARVAGWTWRLGVRSAPPAPVGVWSIHGLLAGGLAAAVVTSELPGNWRLFGLGAIFGYYGLELANNIRAAHALRAVAATRESLQHWLDFPLRARLGVVSANSVGTAFLLALVGLLRPDPGLFGALAGALVQLRLQSTAARNAVIAAEAAAADGPQSADSEGAPSDSGGT